MRLYNCARWRRKRNAQLRQFPLCRLCQLVGRTKAASVADHVVPHHGDPHKFWYGELQSLCKICHDAVKQSLEKTGVLRGCGKDGVPLDPNHSWHDSGEGV